MLPLFERVAVDQLSDLLGTRRSHCAIAGIEFQAGRLEMNDTFFNVPTFGLGFGVTTDPGQSQVISSAGEYSWGGIAETKFRIDPEEDLIAILMTQMMWAPWPTRYQMKVATYQALTELGKD